MHSACYVVPQHHQGSYSALRVDTTVLLTFVCRTGRMEEADKTAPIGVLCSPVCLRPEYVDAALPGYIPGIDYLATKYRNMRRVLGDGNCFYRAFLFSYLEMLLKFFQSTDNSEKQVAEAERLRIYSLLLESKSELVEIGYSEIAIESFHDVIDDDCML